LGWVIGDHSAKTFEPLWAIVATWHCFFYVTDGWPVYPKFIPAGDQIISKTYMTRVEGENNRREALSGPITSENTLLF
jgi:IS1 family transposase